MRSITLTRGSRFSRADLQNSADRDSFRDRWIPIILFLWWV